MKRRKKIANPKFIWLKQILLLISLQFVYICYCSCDRAISFKGIPAAFGDLDFNKRTDIVVIGDDGRTINVHLQFELQPDPQSNPSFTCSSDQRVVQVYIADIDGDGNPNLLALLEDEHKSFKISDLKSIRAITQKEEYLTPNTAYSLASAAALNSGRSSNNSAPESLPLKGERTLCEFEDIEGIRMQSHPFLFDLDGDLLTDFMGLGMDGNVTVWKAPKNPGQKYEKHNSNFWRRISKDYFAKPHSHAFVDMNQDNSADIVLSANGANGAKFAYLYANRDAENHFNAPKEMVLETGMRYGQSSFVDINADGRIDHIIPRCEEGGNRCEIVVLFENNALEVIFSFKNDTTNHDYNYLLESKFIGDYEFPVTLRSSDLDADGYIDFVAVARDERDSKSKVIYLHNKPDKGQDSNTQLGFREIKRTFELLEIKAPNADFDMSLVTLFDINEDGKIDMLIGHCEKSSGAKPGDMSVYSEMNKQMVDAYFMKVLVTNGRSNEAGSNGQSARGASICFELSQNDGNKMKGCFGQQTQSSYFALQQTYAILGLGQTPHFVETLRVSIPGFSKDGSVRTKLMEQIVPDAQIIIIPKNRDLPQSWEYKMFLSPMSELVPPTLIALAVICVLLLIIIFILHRKETLEDAAEHEEYKRHWPESR